jgi:hypothetical protein
MFQTSLSLHRHRISTKDHQGVRLALSSYADPDIEWTDVQNHVPEWDQRPDIVAGLGRDNGDSLPEEDELDEGQPDQIFEGAGIPLKSMTLIFEGSQMRMDREFQSQGRKLKPFSKKHVASLRMLDIKIGGIHIIPDNNFGWHDEMSSQ